MQTQTYIYKDLDTVIEHAKKMGIPKACARSFYSKINANSSSSNLFLRSVPNVLNLLDMDPMFTIYLDSTIGR